MPYIQLTEHLFSRQARGMSAGVRPCVLRPEFWGRRSASYPHRWILESTNLDWRSVRPSLQIANKRADVSHFAVETMRKT